MDIEGCEYQSLLSMPEKYLKKFKIIVIEFHDLERLEKTRFLNQIFDPVINKILNYFDCVHIHGNNFDQPDKNGDPIHLEVTFLRNELLNENEKKKSFKEYPLKDLDYPNNTMKSDIPIKFLDN